MKETNIAPQHETNNSKAGCSNRTSHCLYNRKKMFWKGNKYNKMQHRKKKKKKLALALCIGYKHTQLKKKRVWELFIFCIYISVCVCVNDIQELSSFVSSVHILIHLARCHSVCLASVVIFIYYIYILLLQVFSSHFS